MLLVRLREVRDLCSQFHEAVRVQWMTENKIFGMDVQDLRLGGLEARVDAAIRRVEDYLCGRVSRLEELEQERLYADGRPEDSQDPLNTHMWYWRDVVTAGVLER